MASLLKLTSCFHARTSSSRASLPDDWILFLFLGNSGSFFNFSQTHKWSGILTCLSLQKSVYSFRINEWIRSWLSLFAHHPPSLCTRTLEGGRLVSIRWLENFDHMALTRGKWKRKMNPRCVTVAVCDLACVASVSNRLIARKLEREQKKKFVPLPLPRHSFFLLSSQLFSTNSRGNACYAGYVWPRCVAFQFCPRTCTRIYFFQSTKFRSFHFSDPLDDSCCPPCITRPPYEIG